MFSWHLQHRSPDDSTVVLVFAVVSIVVLTAFGVCKLVINRHVASKALEQVRGATRALLG